jgi:YbbR domain-containing protein
MRGPSVLTRNVRLKLLAVAVALVTWTVVVYAANPPDARTLSVPVPQDAQSLPGNFILASRIPDMNVRVEGTRDHIDAFSLSSLRVTVNYGVIHRAGTQSIPVTIVNNDRNVDVTDAPTSVMADVDTQITEKVQVEFNIIKGPPAGYLVSDKTATPSTVDVSGPSKALQGLRAFVDVDLANRTAPLDQDRPVRLVDRTGHSPSNVAILSGSPVAVHVEIASTNATRSSAVIIDLSGQPAAGHVFSGISYQPLTVVVTGPQSVINGLDKIHVPVSLNGLTGDRTFTIALQVSPGITVQPDTVTVVVSITALPSPTPSPSPRPTPTPSPTPSPSASPSPTPAPT